MGSVAIFGDSTLAKRNDPKAFEWSLHGRLKDAGFGVQNFAAGGSVVHHKSCRPDCKTCLSQQLTAAEAAGVMSGIDTVVFGFGTNDRSFDNPSATSAKHGNQHTCKDTFVSSYRDQLRRASSMVAPGTKFVCLQPPPCDTTTMSERFAPFQSNGASQLYANLVASVVADINEEKRGILAAGEDLPSSLHADFCTVSLIDVMTEAAMSLSAASNVDTGGAGTGQEMQAAGLSDAKFSVGWIEHGETGGCETSADVEACKLPLADEVYGSFFSDGLHPNEKGCELMYKALLSVLQVKGVADEDPVSA